MYIDENGITIYENFEEVPPSDQIPDEAEVHLTDHNEPGSGTVKSGPCILMIQQLVALTLKLKFQLNIPSQQQTETTSVLVTSLI